MKITKQDLEETRDESPMELFRQGIGVRHLRPHLTDYLAEHKHALSDISFQCDHDCLNFIKDNGLKHMRPANAHMLADIVAWGNSHNRKMDGVIDLDLTMAVRNHLLKIFKIGPIPTSARGSPPRKRRDPRGSSIGN